MAINVAAEPINCDAKIYPKSKNIDFLRSESNELYIQGDYAASADKLEQILSIWRQFSSSEYIGMAEILNNLGVQYEKQGKYKDAIRLHKQALLIKQACSGQELSVAMTLNNLGMDYLKNGQYADAEDMYRQAASIRESVLQLFHENSDINSRTLNLIKELAGNYNDLGELFRAQHNLSQAEQYIDRGLRIKEEFLTDSDPDLAMSLNSLALIKIEMENYSEAEPLLEHAIKIWKSFNSEHPEYFTTLDNLAGLYYEQGNYPKALQIFKETLSHKISRLGVKHVDVAEIFFYIGLVQERQKKFIEAELNFDKSLAIWEEILGSKHLDMIRVLSSLSDIYTAQNRYSDSIKTAKRIEAISEYNLLLNLGSGSDRQNLSYLYTTLGVTSRILSLHLEENPQNVEALRLALLTVLHHKGRVLDTSTQASVALRNHMGADERILFDKLRAVHGQLSDLTTRGLGPLSSEDYRAFHKLERDADTIEGKLRKSSAKYSEQNQPVTLEDVQSALPKEAALIELTIYYPFNSLATSRNEYWGDPQYAAYVLHPQGEPCAVKLGAAKDIERKVEAWRLAIDARSDSAARGKQLPGAGEVTEIPNVAQALYHEIIAPIREQCLGDTKTFFFSPDGAFNLVPIGALVDDSGSYLIQDYHITYLTSGRDLLRLKTEMPNQSKAVVVSDPDYGSADNFELLATSDEDHKRRRSRDFSGQVGTFDRLEKAAEEAEAVKKLLRLPKEQWLTDKRATEGAVKALRGPQILHIATHGFFLPDEKNKLPESVGTIGTEHQLTLTQTENPLLRSGLALAGANRLISGQDDGILTALEASGLDLWGTKLVVLSACKTGVGDVRTGEGVYGLRRALVNAGAESQVLSLWRVNDASTKDLMLSYYQELLAGEGRSEGLRKAQLKMIKSSDHNHPYYWAAFIPSGQWKSLDVGQAW